MRRFSIETHCKIQNIITIIGNILYAAVIISAIALTIINKYNQYFLIIIGMAIFASILQIIAYYYNDWIIDQKIIYYHHEDEFTIRRKK